MSMIPAIVTLPLASSVTDVFATLRANRTVTPEGMLTVVKLKTPLGGRFTVTLPVGLNGPSAPVLPLLNVWAQPSDAPHDKMMETTIAAVILRCFIGPSVGFSLHGKEIGPRPNGS
jgi:hypothetical protein